MVETAADSAYQKGQLYQLNLSDLNPDPNQPRKSLDPQALEELTASIKEHGVLQPILFRVDAALGIGGHDAIVSPDSGTVAEIVPQGNALFIVAGERRFEAAKMAGLATIPAIFVDGNTSEIALVENLLRQDLTAVEEAEALQRLKDEQKYTDEQLGTIIGKARTTLNETLSLNKLPQEIRDECRADRTITKSTLITIARKKQARAMTTAYNAYKAKQQKKLGDMMKSCPPISRKTVETPGVIIDWVTKTTTKLQTQNSKLSTQNYANWTEEDQISYQTALTSLKTEIETYLFSLLK